MTSGKKQSFRNQTKKFKKLIRREKSYSDKMNDKFKAFKRGKKVFLTIKNPNKSETNKRFIKVKAKEVW